MKDRTWKARILLIAILLICAILLSATAAQPAAQKQPVLRVSFLVQGNNMNDWTAMQQGAWQAANDFRIDLRFLTTSIANDATEQTSQINYEIAAGAQAIILSAADRTALIPCVAQSKIPIVTVSSGVSSDAVAYALSANDLEMAFRLAVAIAPSETNEQTIAILRSSSGARTNQENRLYGLQEGLRGMGCLSEVISVTNEELQNPKLLRKRLLQNNIVGVAALELPELECAAQALVNDSIPIVGFGANSTILHDLESGTISQIAVSNSFAMGYLAVKQAYSILTDQKQVVLLPKIEYHLITADTMYDPQNQWLLFPIGQ